MRKAYSSTLPEKTIYFTFCQILLAKGSKVVNETVASKTVDQEIYLEWFSQKLTDENENEYKTAS